MLDGISPQGEFTEGVEDRVLEELRRHFRPEFLNRVDEIVLFKPLMLEQIMHIVDLLMQRLLGRLAERKIRVSLTDKAKRFVAESAYDPVYGARPLKRYLQQRLETPLARRIIAGELRDGQQVTVDTDGHTLFFE
jgi:ATP-dependent Clp protease ATP-binding subunit ClpB